MIAMRTALYFAVTVCLTCGRAISQTPTLDRDSIDFLIRLNQEDGGYAPHLQAAPARSSLRATAAAVRALRYFGSKPASPAVTAGFIERCYDKRSGGFADFPGQRPTVATTAVGAMAAVDLNLSPDVYRDGAVRYLSDNAKLFEDIRIAAAAFEAMKLRPPKAADWLRKYENPAGSGPETALVAGGTTVLILRLGGTIENRNVVLKTMLSGQRSDGGFGSPARDESDLDSTYRVMRAFMMMKERPAEPDRVRDFITKCRHQTGGYGTTPGDPPSAAGTYYAAAVLHWLAER
jgi:prenyltransferase beta subunit